MVEEAGQIIVSDKGRTERIELPSGEWWEFSVPTKHRHVSEYRKFIRPVKELLILDSALIYFTASWSFGIAVSVESLEDMDIADTNAAMMFWNDAILPLLNPQANRTPNDSS